METDILTTIIARKRETLAHEEEAVCLDFLKEYLGEPQPGRSMRQSLAASDCGIIAEFKRRSPSKGWIHQGADPLLVEPAYAAAGASALSILTDEPFFGGRLKDLQRARPTVDLPILRKDFIISTYQLYQAKVAGADAVLLIAAALDKDECHRLAEEAHRLQLEVLLELHSEDELDYVNDSIDMVGVNNRHLGTFHTDVETSFRLAERLPQDKLLVSESGLSQPATVRRLREAGFRGFLIGEAFMKTAEPGKALADFIRQLREGADA